MHDLGLDEDEYRAALEDVHSLEYEPIFGAVYEDELDPFRVQANIKTLTPTIEAIHRIIAAMISINEAWSVDASTCHALRSLPGGSDQAVHRDYPMFETAQALISHELVEASVIVVLMEATYLHVYPRSFGGPVDRTRRRTVRLDRGHMIMFRGDLAHAGAGFRRTNVRLHCCVQVNGVPQVPNSTEAVMSRSYHCNRCMTLTYSRAKLSEHRRVCVLKGGPYWCLYCGQIYAFRNSLNQHVRQRHREPLEQESSPSEGSTRDSAAASESSDED